MGNLKKAFITGITGQSGSYLAELLLEKGYMVHGMIRRASNFNTQRIEHIYNEPNLKLHYGDMTDPLAITNLISEIKPDEIYNLAAQSHVKVSFEQPAYTAQVDAIGTLNVLEAMRTHCPTAKFYQASTSELYGKIQDDIQDEYTPFYPRSPYGVAKLYSYWIVKNYRESYGLYACNGILFNHESERRGSTFVTKKVTEKFADIFHGDNTPLKIGNMEAQRDWGYAKEYVEGMWRMLQQDEPDDFVLATGKTYTIRYFIEETAKHIGHTIRWEGSGEDEKGYSNETGQLLVEIDPEYFRPAEVELLIGNPTKAKEILGWEAKVQLDELIEIMIKHDIDEKRKLK